MKRVLLILVLLPTLSFGQYWGERVAEKSFEQSALYFKSYFLNPYGLYRFGDAAVGLVDDPFLQLQINPADLPDLDEDNYLLYLDFRGDRNEEEVIDNYYSMPIYDYGYYPDPRWYSITREEPQPLLSFGVLAYPFEGSKDLFLGCTYQTIYEQEKFYTPPTWIYNYRFGYDAFGEKQVDDLGPGIPVEDRYYGKDELLTQAHLYAFLAGYSIRDGVDVGLSFNGVSHSRDGGYISSRNDEYGGTYQSDYSSYREEARNQDYHHHDIAAGLRYRFTPGVFGGIKIGRLSGEADQDYLSADSSVYKYGTKDVTTNWSEHFGRSRTSQVWNRQGHTWYGSVDYSRELSLDGKLNLYYKYSHGEADLSSNSTIRDTSWYSSQHTYDTITYKYYGHSWTIDDRYSTGTRKNRTHEAMARLKWKVTPKSEVYAGCYFSRERTEIESSEPIISDRLSVYTSEKNDSVTYSRYYRRYESKHLEWDHSCSYWTLQIPVFLRLQVNENITTVFGVNRILESWHTKDQTTAYFTIRETNINGTLETEEYFGERYTLPDEKTTEDYTALIASIEVAVSQQMSIRLLVNPDLDDGIRIAQWWLSFQVTP